MRGKIVVGFLIATVFMSVAAAHAHRYVGGTGDERVVVCEFTATATCAGGVVLPQGEVVDGFVGVSDQVVDPVSFLLCQDSNLDGRCTSFEDRNTTHCSGVQLTAGVDWNPSADLYVYIDGPVFGNPVTSDCGLTASTGSSGVVFHT